jgi:hypothetical protein
MRLRRVETQAGASASDANSGVDAKDSFEMDQSLAAEVSRSGIVSAELNLKTLPRDYRWLPQVAHPVGKPHVEIHGQG